MKCPTEKKLDRFTGVDVFFVISGYLISGHIVRELQTGKFSFWSFYAKRTRRIAPSLITILLFSLGMGWLYLSKTEFSILGKHIQSGALYLSNFRLWSETGYFDARNESKPLLHLWSLAVEEQFYLFWPLVLFVFYRNSRRFLAFTTFVTLALFGLNLFFSGSRPDFNFYMLPTRLWELTAGFLVHLSAPKFQKHYDSWVAQVLGFGLILFAFLKIQGGVGYPGTRALIPVFGAGLLLGATPRAPINRFVLSSRFLGFFGTISFSLYLWHWTLFSFMKSLMLEDQMVWLGVLTFVLTILTHLFIEKPLMNLTVTRKSAPRIVIIGTAILFAIAGAGTLVSAGLIQGRMNSVLLPPPVSKPVRVETGCSFDGSEGKDFNKANLEACEKIANLHQPFILLMGDSHAGAISPAIQKLANEININLVSIAAIFCPPLNTQASNRSCKDYNLYMEDYVKKFKPSLILYDTNYSLWVHDIDYKQPIPYPSYIVKKLEEFKQWTGKEVLLIGQNPGWKISLPRVLNVGFLVHGRPVPERTYLGIEEDSLHWDDQMRDAVGTMSSISYFSIREEICNPEGCMVRVGDNLASDLMDFDYGHITYAGGVYVVEHGLGEKIKELLKRTALKSQ